MKDRDEIGFCPLELVAEKLAEQVVVAVPLASGVNRDEEEVGAFEFLEDLSALATFREGVTERARQTLEDGRSNKERAQLVGLAFEDLGGEVVDEVAIVAGEALDGILCLAHALD